jgi:hypothetical protein
MIKMVSFNYFQICDIEVSTSRPPLPLADSKTYSRLPQHALLLLGSHRRLDRGEQLAAAACHRSKRRCLRHARVATNKSARICERRTCSAE